MAQWGAGFQYPLQTGYNNPQFQQQNPQFQQQPQQFQQQPPQQQFQQQTPQFQPQQQQQGGFGAPSAALLPQQTGYPVQRPQFLQQQPQIGFQQPQQTGFAPQGLLQQQPTGFVGGTFQQTRAPPPPVPALPPQFQRPNNGSTFLIPQNQQQQQPQQQQPPTSGFLSPSPALGGIGMGIASQPTGYAPRAAPLVPQMTGYVDPRLQMMSATFMPSTPFGGAAPQLAPPPQQNLIQSIQQHNEAARGTARQTMSWTLSKAEKKNYNDIFRNWDAQNTGFISGHTALEVFGASGLPKDDLARIWTLADIDDRGKLNVQEFHVAMGLIYRRLNGMPIPEQLPQELIPPSARDLDESVEAVKSLLQYENRSRSPSSIDSPVSRLKNRSFNTTGSSIESGRDATIYKHSDSEPPGGFYKPRSRHVDRDAVRRTDDVSSSSDLSDMKRQLANTAQMLDRASEATAEDEELDREMDDLKYRVKRVQDDIDYVSRGPKTASKEEERRKLERELLSLMHERVPEVERKIKARDERKEREKRQWARDRDRANERFGRYDDKDRDRDYATRRGDDRDRPYSRNERGYDRDEREGRESRNRDREGRESRNRDRDYDPREREWDRRDTYDRPRSAAPRSPPPPASPSTTLSANPTGALPPPRTAPSPAPLKNMTPEERLAYARAQAQQRIEARKVALGVISPSSAPSSAVMIDTAVEDRLQQDKKEAEEKAKQAEKEREERERVRRERVESERAAREPVVPTKSTPTATATAPPPVPTARTAPPPAIKLRAPAPPPPRKAAPRQVPVTPKVAPVVPKADLEEGRRRAEEERIRAQEEERIRVEQERTRADEEKVRAEEEKFRVREEALRKQREERAARIRQLEREEEEQERLEEERYRARVEALKARSATPKVVEPPVKVAQEPVKIPEPVKATPPAVIPSFVPQASANPATPIEKSTNPFSRLLSQGASAPTTPAVTTPAAATNGSTNPWAARPQTAPPPSKSPVSSAVKTSYQTVPAANEDDWDIIKEKNESDDDSSDDELAQSRTARANIAQQLFGSMLPRPQSSGPVSSPSSPAPVTGAGVNPPPPPPAPQAPPAMFAPLPATAVTPPAGDVSALMQSIQGGMKLRPTKTVDKSAPPVSGRVIGDTAPPAHINVNVAPTPAQEQPHYPERVSSLPEPTPMDDAPKLSNRQSVGWFTTRAADAGVSPVDQLPVTVEAEEDDNDDIYATPPPIPSIQVDEHVSEPVLDLMADIDKSIQHRARSLYAYEGDGPEDLSFAENLVLTVHPSKSGSDWWYGTTLRDGKSGLFPKTYIEVFQTTKAKAIYAYESNNTDECSFDEGDELMIVDKSDAEWWKTEQNGVVLIVPAAYLEDVEDTSKAVQATVQLSEITVRPPETIQVNQAMSHQTEQDDDDSSGEEVDDDSDSDSCDSEYLSFDDTPEHHHHHHHPETDEERIDREREKQLVLEAAGLIVNQDTSGPPPKLVRAKSKSKRRPAPAVPVRSFSLQSISKDLPPVPVLEEPELEIDHATRLDDAFARYESFRDAQLNRNRLSVVSTDSSNTISTLPASPTSLTSPPVLSPSHSQGRESEGRYSQFLHFLTRSKTPEQGDKRTTLVISAPIMSTSTSAASFADEPSRTNSPSFGTSWASLVDKTALEGIPPGERKRQEAIFELINTEVAYVRDLQLIVEVFYSSMLPLLSTKEITVVFANIEDLLLTNTGFVSSLEERQKDCRLYVDRIGDIVLNHLPNMGVYMEYCVNQGTAIKVLQSLRNSNPELAQHLQRLRDDPSVRNLDLSSYLLAPMQRITRYPLLIKQILHYTEVGEEHEAIKSARNISEKLLDHINETIRDQEGMATLKEISQYLWVGQGRLDLTAPTRYMGARKLIKQGVLLKTKSGRKLQAFLCSDILVLTDKLVRTLYRMPIPLAHAQVMGEPKDDCTFKITQAYPRGGDSISLKALSSRDCQQWIQEIDTSGRRCRHAEERAARKSAHRR